jgi:hypothetical protein
MTDQFNAGTATGNPDASTTRGSSAPTTMTNAITVMNRHVSFMTRAPYEFAVAR